jgi:glycosyltransferase involved in cell wall biosynthesis
MKKLTILFINDTTKLIGGAEVYMYNLQNLLESHGHRVHILGGQKGVGLKDSFFSRWFSVSYYKQAKAAINTYKPDLVHIHGISRVVSPSVLVAAKRSHIPIVQTTHDYHFICPKLWMITDQQTLVTTHDSHISCLLHHLPKKPFLYGLFKHIKTQFHNYFFARYIDTFICASQDITGWYRRLLPTKSIFHVPYFVSESFQHTPLRNHNSILFLGRISKEKGIDLLLNAFATVVRSLPQTTLTIAGEGKSLEQLKHLCQKLQIAKQVFFVGKKQEKALLDTYTNTAIVVIPSVWLETGPLVAYEALLMGRPLVGANAGGIKDIILHEKTGLLFERNNKTDLADKLITLLQDPNLQKRISQNQKERADAYSQYTHLQAIEHIYQKTVTQYETH